jgi:uncharacterized protein (DUF169 family)
MTDVKQLDDVVTRYVRLTSYPIAIKMVTSSEEVPKSAGTSTKDLSMLDVHYKALALARRHGCVVAKGEGDNACPNAAIAFGWYKPSRTYLGGGFQAAIYGPGGDIPVRTRQAVLHHDFAEYRQVVLAPARPTGIVLDVIVLQRFLAQMTPLPQGLPDFDVDTRPSIDDAACIGMIVATMLTDEPHLIMGRLGDRITALTQDSKIVFATPVRKGDPVPKALKRTYKVRHRYSMVSSAFDRRPLPQTYGGAMVALKQRRQAINCTNTEHFERRFIMG